MLAVCRSLRRGGYEVGAASFTALAPAQWSRACRRRPRVIDARRDATGFVEQLRAELLRRPYAALIPGSDSALLAISRRRERLRGLTAIGLPTHSILERALSRESLAEAAEEAGLTVVPSVRCAGLQAAQRAARELGFPVALKSTDAVVADDCAVSSAPKGRIVRTEAELREQASDFRGDLLVQSVVRGEPISFGGIRAGGRLLGVAVSRYLRMWPPPGGSVAFAQTIASPPGLEEGVERLLAILGWEGIFELELIRSGPPESERFVPIDLNPRPYGSIALAAAAGVPLAAIWCDWLLGRGAPSSSSVPLRAQPGIRYRWEDAELRYCAWQMRHRHLRASIAPLRPRRHVAHAHFERSDPLPLLARGLFLGKRVLQKS